MRRLPIAIIAVCLLLALRPSLAAVGSDSALDDVELDPAGDHLRLQQHATTLKELVDKTRPTFVWSGKDCPSWAHDLLWVTHNVAGKPTFAMNRAYALKVVKGQPAERCLFDADKDAQSDWFEYAREVDVSPAILARDPHRGVVYRAVWHSLPNSGTGHIRITRQLFLLCDASHHWRFIGEGPEERTGRYGLSNDYQISVATKIVWTNELTAPVQVLCTETETHECFTEGNQAPEVAPLSLCRDGTFGGASPAPVRWNDLSYVIAERDEPIEAVAVRVAGWRTSYAIEADVRRERLLVRAVIELIGQSNPNLPAILPAGRKVFVRPSIGQDAERRAPKTSSARATPSQ